MPEDSRNSSNSQPETGNIQQKRPNDESPKSQAGKLWDAFGNPDQPVNALANATYKPPGKNPKDATYSEVIGSMSLSEFSRFCKTGCARESLMTGMGAAFGVSGIRAMFGGIHSLKTIGNWAVGAFAVTTLAAFEFCRRRRILERAGMKEAVEMMQELKLKKQREKEMAAEEAARLALEERKKKSWTNLSGYKFW